MSAKEVITFTEQEIQALFGHEAAEDEDLDRLKEYYFKTSTYDQIVNDLPLRLLVGHKGIGKSALFQVAIAEYEEAGNLAVLIQPNDIASLGTDTSDFLQSIREWTIGLTEIIARKVLTSIGTEESDIAGQLARYGGVIVDFLKTTFRQKMSNIDFAPSNQKVLDTFLKKGRVNVFIDDLDRGWQGRAIDITRISALLNAVRDMVKINKGVSFRISLRSDVYYLVRTSDESTDKIEGSVIWQNWDNHEIFCLLIKRIETFFGKTVDENQLLRTRQRDLAYYLDPVMEPKFSGMGHWQNAPVYRVLMSLIRKRPRDLVKLCTLAARQAQEQRHMKIVTSDLESIFEEYSQGRLQDTVNEYRSELPEIERLLINMKPNRKERKARSGYIYTTDQLFRKIEEITTRGAFKFSRGSEATKKELASFLYKINFEFAAKTLKLAFF